MRYKKLQPMMRNYADGGDVEDTALDPQSAPIAQAFKHLLTDKADKHDTQSIQPVASPIDLLAGGIGASVPEALSEGSIAGARNKILAGMANPLDDMAAMIRSPNSQTPAATDIAAYQQKGLASPRIAQALAQGDTAQKIVNALDRTPGVQSVGYANALNKALVDPNGQTLPGNVYNINEGEPRAPYQEAPDKFANLAEMIRKRRQ